MKVTVIGFKIPGLSLVKIWFSELYELGFCPALGSIGPDVYALITHAVKENFTVGSRCRKMPVVNKLMDFRVRLLGKYGLYEPQKYEKG